jgi:hypothetical protein
MSQKSNIHNPDKDALLNELIRACWRDDSQSKFVRPSPDAITAYLMGTATKRQKKAVTKALSLSSAFCQEILEMAKDMDALENMELSTSEDITVPDRQEFMEKVAKRIIPVRKQQSFWVKLKAFWTKPFELRIPRLYAPALAAAVILALVIIQIPTYIAHKTYPPVLTQKPERPNASIPENKSPLLLAQLSLVSEKTDPGELRLKNTRGIGSRMVSDNPRDAALAVFRDVLNYQNNEFQLVPSAKSPEPSPLSHGIVLRLVDSTGITIRDFQAYIPVSKTESLEPVMAWVLGLPSRNLSRINMLSDTVLVAWTEDMGTKGCVTFTYHGKKGYGAVAGSTFDLAKNDSSVSQ